MRPHEPWAGVRQRLLSSGKTDFASLLRLAGLDPARHMRYADWSGADFAGSNLDGFDFTGARLVGCSFEGARVSGARFGHALIDEARPYTKLDASRTSLRAAKDWDAFVEGWQQRTASQPPDDHLPVGAVFQDAPLAPELVVLPAGEFLMGPAQSGAAPSVDDDTPRKRTMLISRRFALSRCPVTFEEYDMFLKATEHKRNRGSDEADSGSWGRGARPVINVSWDEVQQYCDWLNEVTGLQGELGFRLPSEVEWEYACRAGTRTQRWWGDEWDTAKANGKRNFKEGQTSPVGHYAANPWGLHDMIGNVWELCGEQHLEHVRWLAPDGTAYREGGSSPRVLRGGSWFDVPGQLASGCRNQDITDVRNINIGFRIARTLGVPDHT